MLLGFNGLMQPLVIAASEHQTAGKFIDDDNTAVLYHIIDIPLHNAVGLHGLIDVMRNRRIFRIGQIFNMKPFFCLFHTMPRKRGSACFFIYNIIFFHILHQILIVCFLNNLCL